MTASPKPRGITKSNTMSGAGRSVGGSGSSASGASGVAGGGGGGGGSVSRRSTLSYDKNNEPKILDSLTTGNNQNR